MLEKKERLKILITGKNPDKGKIFNAKLCADFNAGIGFVHVLNNNIEYKQIFNIENSIKFYKDEGADIYLAYADNKYFVKPDVVLYLDEAVEEKKFFQSLITSNPVYIDFDMEHVDIADCLYQIELLFEKRQQQITHFHMGINDPDSTLSYLNKDVTNHISLLHNQVTSEYSTASFFKPFTKINYTEYTAHSNEVDENKMCVKF